MSRPTVGGGVSSAAHTEVINKKIFGFQVLGEYTELQT
jgi:hypothetical protein